MWLNLFFFAVAALLLLQEASAKLDSRIIGGADAENGQFPFAAAIRVQTSDSTFFCGGVLARSQWIVTSGHCVYNATVFTIQLGSTTLTQEDSNRLTLSSSEYYIHPDFNPETLEGDEGLIKLNQTVTLNDFITNIPFYLTIVQGNTTYTIMGWGQTTDSASENSEQLQYVEVLSMENEECKVVYGDQIKENMLCVEGKSNEGTCTGDIGGPLLMKVGASYHSVGIASFISGNGCESTDPSGFTRISSYYSWMSSIMG